MNILEKLNKNKEIYRFGFSGSDDFSTDFGLSELFDNIDDIENYFKSKDGETDVLLTDALDKQYSDKVDVENAAGTKGKTFGVSLDGGVIKVQYQGKANSGDVTYTINAEGVVSK